MISHAVGFNMCKFTKTLDMKTEENFGLLVRLKAKTGKQVQVKELLLGAQEMVGNEIETISWFAFQIDDHTFGIYDTFQTEQGRQAHLNGAVAKALLANADELLENFNPSKAIQPVALIARDIKTGNQNKGLVVTMKAKAGKEKEVEDFLKVGQKMVHDKEPKTVSWYAMNLGEGTYGIFDTADDEEGRTAHLNGEVAAALMENAPLLLDGFTMDNIKKVDILASK